MPAEAQDDLAKVLMRLSGQQSLVYQLSAEEEADRAVADAEMARGDFATDGEVEAMLSKYRRRHVQR